MNKEKHNCHRGNRRKGRGPSSYHMQDPEVVFEKLALKQGDILVDLGCGAGDYSLHAAKIVGKSGKIYAVDRWEDMLAQICTDGAADGIKNIVPVVSDISKTINIADNSADICFISTVLHAMDFYNEAETLCTEIKRILKKRGKLAVIECKKENSMYGPPMERRLSVDDLSKVFSKFGFQKIDYIDLGYNYMVIYNVTYH